MPSSIRFGIAKAWGESSLVAGRWLCGLRWEVEGQENIPDVPSVIMIKHTTVFEAYAQLTIFPPQAWVLKRELLWLPAFGWGLAAMKPIAIDRGAGVRAVQQVVEQVAVLALLLLNQRGQDAAPSSRRQSANRLDDLLGRLGLDLAAATGTTWPTEPGEQDTEIVLDLGDGSHGAPRVPASRLLLDRD